MVSDKFQVRSTGPINPLTRQPIKGRKLGGGIRLGEMERDALLAHGAAYVLHDRLHTCSDYSTLDACASCGSILSPAHVPSGETRRLLGRPLLRTSHAGRTRLGPQQRMSPERERCPINSSVISAFRDCEVRPGTPRGPPGDPRHSDVHRVPEHRRRVPRRDPLRLQVPRHGARGHEHSNEARHPRMRAPSHPSQSFSHHDTRTATRPGSCLSFSAVGRPRLPAHVASAFPEHLRPFLLHLLETLAVHLHVDAQGTRATQPRGLPQGLHPRVRHRDADPATLRAPVAL